MQGSNRAQRRLVDSSTWCKGQEFARQQQELDYWLKSGRDESRAKYLKYLELWGLPQAPVLPGRVVGIGAGPLGGVLPYIDAAYVASIDPLNDVYREHGLLKHELLVHYITVDLEQAWTAQEIIQHHPFDIVFSANSLDHLDDPLAALKHVSWLLRPGGLFYLHMHLRTPAQLDEGHRVYIELSKFYAALEANDLFETGIFSTIFPKDPTGNGEYETLIGVYRKTG